jgi:hypothetical protein
MGQPTALRQAVDRAIEDILRWSHQSLGVDTKVLAAGRVAVLSRKALLTKPASKDERRRREHLCKRHFRRLRRSAAKSPGAGQRQP